MKLCQEIGVWNFRLVVDTKLSKGDPVNGYGVDFRASTNTQGAY